MLNEILLFVSTLINKRRLNLRIWAPLAPNKRADQNKRAGLRIRDDKRKN